MQLLRVLYLPQFPQSITYRPWASERGETPLLRWFVERLAARYPVSSLLIACHEETDRSKAEEALRELDVFVIVCAGDTLLSALGELAVVFPRWPIAYFHLEMMFAPSDLLDRVAEHHVAQRNDFTGISDLPPLLAPEIADPGLLASLAAVDFEGSVPSPGEAVQRLSLIRSHNSAGPGLRAIPFSAGKVYELPVLPRVSHLQTADDAQRSHQALAGLPASYEFEALDRWPATTFDPLVGLDDIKAGSTTRPKILYLSPGCLYSGAEESLRSLAQGLDALGFHQTAVVSLEGVLAQNLRQVGCQVISANWYFNAAPGTDASVLHASGQFAAAVLDKVRPDFIHCNGDPGSAFLSEARKMRLPLVAHVRNAKFGSCEDLFDAASQLIAVSGFVKRRLQQTGIPASRITVVYNGVDADRFSPGVFDKAAMRKKFELPLNAFVIVMIASFFPAKRHDLMIEAFSRLQHHDPSVRLVLVGFAGDSHVIQGVRARIAKELRPASVILLPFQADIREIECAADVVVLPSDNEALARCILEAMSLGIPTVASDSGGTCELFEHGVSGLAMTGGDAGSLTTALQHLLDDEGLRNRIAREGRKRVEACFTLHEYGRNVQRVLYHCAGTTCWYGTCQDTG